MAAGLRVEMRARGVDAPYVHRRGDFRARFSLVYASLDDVLPQLEELCLLAHRGDGKDQRTAAAEQLQEIVDVSGGRADGRAGGGAAAGLLVGRRRMHDSCSSVPAPY